MPVWRRSWRSWCRNWRKADHRQSMHSPVQQKTGHGHLRIRCANRFGLHISGCRKSPSDFFDSLHNASLFCPRSGPKSCRCAAQTPADTGFLQAFDPTRGGSRAPLRLCDSRPLLGRQSRRFLETGSLFPPLAALRQFPPRTPPAKKNSFPSDRVSRQPEPPPQEAVFIRQ